MFFLLIYCRSIHVVICWRTVLLLETKLKTFCNRVAFIWNTFCNQRQTPPPDATPLSRQKNIYLTQLSLPEKPRVTQDY